MYLIFHTPAQSLFVLHFSRESYTENLQMDDSAQQIKHSGGGKWATLSIVHCSTAWSLEHDCILPKNGKAILGRGSSMRKEMQHDSAGTWEDCGDDGERCRTGQSQELERSAYAAGSCGERTAKAFYWEATLACSAAPSTAAGPCWIQCPQRKLQGWLKT